jgi:hypothetical protein
LVNIATTYDSAELRLYINGVLDNSMTGLFPLARTLDGTASRIGSELAANNENGQFWFSGAISRLDVWNIALCESDILKYAAEAPLPWKDGLAANFNFHLSDNTNFNDRQDRLSRIYAGSPRFHRHSALLRGYLCQR